MTRLKWGIHKSDDDQVLKDYCDGQHCGSHPLNHLDPQWLQLCKVHLYTIVKVFGYPWKTCI